MIMSSNKPIILIFNNVPFEVDTRYKYLPNGLFTFYAKTNDTLNMLKHNHNNINECKVIYPSGKEEKVRVMFKDFRNMEYNSYGYIAQIIGIKG